MNKLNRKRSCTFRGARSLSGVRATATSRGTIGASAARARSSPMTRSFAQRDAIDVFALLLNRVSASRHHAPSQRSAICLPNPSRRAVLAAQGASPEATASTPAWKAPAALIGSEERKSHLDFVGRTLAAGGYFGRASRRHSGGTDEHGGDIIRPRTARGQAYQAGSDSQWVDAAVAIKDAGKNSSGCEPCARNGPADCASLGHNAPHRPTIEVV